MNRWVALLRGMNVGGRRISNAELAAAFTVLGLENVRTYRASGNVVFDSALADEAEVVALLEAGLERELGYPVPALVRDVSALQDVAGHTPFDAEAVAAAKGKLQVLFFATEPDPALEALATGVDRLQVRGREIFWLPSGGTLSSEVDWGQLNRSAGLGTTRTMGTVQGLLKKC